MEGEQAPGTLLSRLRSAYAATTEGQRWTATLALVATATFVLFGLRTEPESQILQRADAPPLASQAVGGRRTAAAEPQVQGLVIQPSPEAALVTVPPPTPSPDTGVAVPEAPLPPTRLVALTRAADPIRGVDDAGIAQVFLPGVGVPVTVLALDPSRADMCEATTAAGNVVVASEGLGRDLRNCLLAAGAVVLSHDQLGSTDRSYSTRLGATPAIVDAAVLGGAEGKIGIAASATIEPEARAAETALTQRGLQATTAVVPEGADSAAAIAAGIRAFVAAGIETVVFAMPVAEQSKWMAVESALAFRPVHIVADVADAIVNEGYLPVFDGTAGVVATRVPWFAREHGETAEQAACREKFEQATGSSVSDDAELARVFMWCQNSQILRSALLSRLPVAESISTVTTTSPLTSSLGAGPGGPRSWGPAQVAVLAWRADCSCWTEETPYQDRPQGSH